MTDLERKHEIARGFLAHPEKGCYAIVDCRGCPSGGMCIFKRSSGSVPIESFGGFDTTALAKVRARMDENPLSAVEQGPQVGDVVLVVYKNGDYEVCPKWDKIDEQINNAAITRVLMRAAEVERLIKDAK